MDGEQNQPVGERQFKPGDTVSPGSMPAEKPAAVAAAVAPPQVDTAPEAQDNPEPRAEAGITAVSADGISWTASEFIAHQKSPAWYLMLGLAAAIVAASVWFLTRDAISTGVIVVGAIVLGIYGARQPRQLGYGLNDHGLTIGEKYHAYNEFRSFAVLDEDAFSSIVFMPLKRFAPLTTIYYAPDDEEKIVNLLSDRLPMEERRHDAVDRLMRRIRY